MTNNLHLFVPLRESRSYKEITVHIVLVAIWQMGVVITALQFQEIRWLMIVMSLLMLAFYWEIVLALYYTWKEHRKVSKRGRPTSKQVNEILQRLWLDGLADGGTGGSQDESVNEAAQALLDHLKAQPELRPTYQGKFTDSRKSGWAAAGANAAVTNIIAMLTRELGPDHDS